MRRILFLPILVACAVSPDSAKKERIDSTASAVLDGVNDTEHSGVVLIAADYPTSPHTCTGFLVTPHLVLTARHCVSKGGESCEKPFTSNFSSYQISNALTPADKDLVPGSDVHLPSTNALCGSDIAFLELPGALSSGSPIALRLGAAPKVDETLTVVGYAQGPAKEQMTRKSITDAQIVSIGPDGREGGPAESDFTVDHGACEGDSGGPALDSSGIAIGVVSRGPASCKNVIYQRVDVHAEWIREVVSEVSARKGDPIPEWALAPTKDAGTKAKGKTKIVPEESDDVPLAEETAPDAPSSSSCAMSAKNPSGSTTGVFVALALVISRRRRRA